MLWKASLVAYANGGLQELTYTGSGVFSSQLDYYSLAGHLIGSSNGTTTSSDLTDAQGSVLLNLTSSAIQGEQAYGPYGNQRSTQGTIGTDKGLHRSIPRRPHRPGFLQRPVL